MRLPIPKHVKTKVERGLHFCRCGAAWETAEALVEHCAVYNAHAEDERKYLEATARAHKLAPKLTADRDKRKR
jgi:hypothetical protein